MELTELIKNKLESGGVTKIDLAKDLGISRVTLDTRLNKGNWKKGELMLLKKMA